MKEVQLKQMGAARRFQGLSPNKTGVEEAPLCPQACRAKQTCSPTSG
jgi:hypothetical protein